MYLVEFYIIEDGSFGVEYPNDTLYLSQFRFRSLYNNAIGKWQETKELAKIDGDKHRKLIEYLNGKIIGVDMSKKESYELGSINTPKKGIETLDLEDRTWYEVRVSMGTNNPIFKAVLYTGFLRNKKPGGYTKLVSNTTELDLDKVHYIDVVKMLFKE